MMLRLTLVLLLACAGCSEPVPERPRPVARRAEAAAAALQKTPAPRTYRYDGSELRVLDVPVSADGKWIDTQRCFVWRDAEFKTASISCGALPDIGPTQHADER